MAEIERIWMDDQDGLIIVGDVLEGLNQLDDNSVEAIVTDPPYELNFMGKGWDNAGVAFKTEIWEACLRVLKPGGYLVAFGGTRTHHRMWCAIEDVGFEVRDMLLWLYGTGFPKSLNVSKAIDKMAGRLLGGQSVVMLKKRLIDLFDTCGKSRQAIDSECGFRACNYLTLPGDGKRPDPWINVLPSQDKWRQIKIVLDCDEDRSAELDDLFREATREVIGTETKARAVGNKSALPSLGAATEYQTWDITAPATNEAKQWDGYGTALKPAVEPILLARKPLIGTVAANVLEHGAGALNIDGTRIGTETITQRQKDMSVYHGNQLAAGKQTHMTGVETQTTGRWPANVLLECTCDDPQPLPEEVRERKDEPSQERRHTEEGATNIAAKLGVRREGGGFVHEPDCSAGMLDAQKKGVSRYFYCAKAGRKEREGSKHPTQKPLALMRWLVRLVTPPDGIVLDPFCGSGSTLVAAVEEGHGFVGIDLSPEYCATAQSRVERAEKAEHD